MQWTGLSAIGNHSPRSGEDQRKASGLDLLQFAILRILSSYPDGRASVEMLKRDLAIVFVPGAWSEYRVLLESLKPDLGIFTQRLVVRENEGWRITDAGLRLLGELEERRGASAEFPE